MVAIFSIRPQYTKLIFAGLKTVELRRTFPRRIEKGSVVLIWESSPKKQLAGTVEVEGVISYPVEELWSEVADDAGISREEFDDYFDGAEFGVAVFFSRPKEFADKPTLSKLRRTHCFRPPQSFRYASESELEFLEMLSQQHIKSLTHKENR